MKMKKTRMLIATLVCAVMMMGVGYAVWYDSVTLAGTVNTGALDVRFENNQFKPFVPKTYTSSCYATAVFNNLEDEYIKFTFDKFHPGVVGVVDVAVKNVGDFPAKLADVTVDITGDEALKNDIYVQTSYYKADANGFLVWGTFGITPYVPLNQLATTLENALKNYELAPGESIIFGVPEGQESELDLNNDGEKEDCFVFYFDAFSDNDTMDKSITIDMEMDWQIAN
jgi:hypothetical protein